MVRQQPITVLIIDDDEDDRFFMEQAFKFDSSDTQVYLATGGQQAFDLLLSAQPLPNVILLDLNMPSMNGYEVLKYLKKSASYQTIPVIILTTSNSPTDQEQVRQLGAKGFITKPTSYGDLNSIAKWIRLTLDNKS